MRSLLKADIEQCFAGVVTGNAVYSYDDSIATVCKTKLLLTTVIQLRCPDIMLNFNMHYALISKPKGA